MALRRTRAWTPKAIPVGLLITLLGAWAFLAPELGAYFNFGFASDDAWQFTLRQWELQLLPGVAAFLGGLMLMTPARGWGWLGGLLAFGAGAWLLVGPSLYPLWASGTVHPYGTETMRALRWIGHFYGVGALIAYFAGYAHGLFSRRTRIQETAAPEPVQTQRVVTPE